MSTQNVILADGGANRFFHSRFKESNNVRAIVGDLDSLKPNVQSYYQEKGVKIHQVYNQETNDF